MMMKKMLMTVVLASLVAVAVLAQSAPPILPRVAATRGKAVWEPGVATDPNRGGFYLALTGTGVTNLFLLDRGSPTNKAVVGWLAVTNGAATEMKLESVLKVLPSGEYRLWACEFTKEGVYSEWSRADFYNAGGVPLPLKSLKISTTMEFEAGP